MLCYHSFSDVIVGFDNTRVSLTEGEARTELCIRIFVPADTDPLVFNFFLDPTTVAGTAGIQYTTHALSVLIFFHSTHRYE